MLTSNVLYTFKYERKYKDPTELVYLKECTTIKSAEEEINKENSFVNYHLKQNLFNMN